MVSFPVHSRVGVSRTDYDRAGQWVSQADLVPAVGSIEGMYGGYVCRIGPRATVIRVNPKPTRFDERASLSVPAGRTSCSNGSEDPGTDDDGSTKEGSHEHGRQSVRHHRRHRSARSTPTTSPSGETRWSSSVRCASAARTSSADHGRQRRGAGDQWARADLPPQAGLHPAGRLRRRSRGDAQPAVADVVRVLPGRRPRLGQGPTGDDDAAGAHAWPRTLQVLSAPTPPA